MSFLLHLSKGLTVMREGAGTDKRITQERIHLTLPLTLPAPPPLPLWVRFHKPLLADIIVQDVVFETSNGLYMHHLGWETVAEKDLEAKLDFLKQQGWQVPEVKDDLPKPAAEKDLEAKLDFLKQQGWKNDLPKPAADGTIAPDQKGS